jgi:hypothetical protein
LVLAYNDEFQDANENSMSGAEESDMVFIEETPGLKNLGQKGSKSQ